MSATPEHRHPGDAEAAAAIAAMNDTYRGYQPRVSDRVRVEKPFIGEHGEGIVLELHGEHAVVDVDGEWLWYRATDLQPA